MAVMTGNEWIEVEKVERGTGIDTITMGLVPKIVDSRSAATLRQSANYWRYAEKQVEEFLKRLPSEFTDGLEHKRFRKEKAAIYDCLGSSPLDLKLGFSPRYNYIPFTAKRSSYSGKDVVKIPVYDLFFKEINADDVSKVVQAAVQQFFLYYSDLDNSSLEVAVLRDRKEVNRGIEILKPYIPKGTIIQARTDFGGGGGKAEYRI